VIKLNHEKANRAVLELPGYPGWLRNEVLFSYGKVFAVVDHLSGYVRQRSESKTTAKHVNEFLRTWGDRFGTSKRRTDAERVGLRHLPDGFFESPLLLGESAEERSQRADCWIQFGRDPVDEG